uniref:Putative effector protein n=1 Tax=Heterodera avenae TaxID=34510 RepID=A0A2L0VDJ7_HETAV|nr:putative effector protein [Heterodera avenae]AVA09712.1 putative effector protein [Heterodera avenae]
MLRQLCILFTLFYLINARTQSVAVQGRFLCGTAPARNVRVKLFDEDAGVDPDDQLDAGYSDPNGNFKLSGHTSELTNIDVVFKVYHDCDDGIKPGSRKLKFKIPNSYVTDSATPKKTFDIGVLNLETAFKDEERELIVTKKKKRGTHRYHHRQRYQEFLDILP